MKGSSLITGLLLAWLLALAPAHAALPTTITHQGMLSQNGTPVTGQVSVVFRLYDSAGSAFAVWSETQTLSVTNGVYSAILGALNPFESGFFAELLWLGITVGEGNPELTPRQPLTAVPNSLYATQSGYAITAGSASSASSASFAGVAAALSGTPALCPAGQYATGIAASGAAAGCAAPVPAMGGDVTGPADTATVVKLRGQGVAATVPATGQVLAYNGSQWAPVSPSAVSSVTMGGDIAGTSGAATVAKIQGQAVASTAPATGQVLTYNGAQWGPGGVPDAQLSANAMLLANAQTVTGVKTFNPATGSVPFAVDPGKTGTVNNLRAQFAAQADSANALSFSAQEKYGLTTSARGRAGTAGTTARNMSASSTRIVLGADGLPAVAFVSVSNLWVAKCSNLTCNTGTTLTQVDASGTAWLGVGAIALGVDEAPVIAYYDAESKDLDFVHCGNPACSAGNTLVLLDSAGDVGHPLSMAIGADNAPVIAYYDATHQALKVLHCGNLACNSGNTITTVDSGGTGSQNSIAIGSDGLPFIAYYDAVNGDLKAVKCGDLACSGGNTISVVDFQNNSGQQPRVLNGANGLPMISYDQTLDYLPGPVYGKLVRCANLACTSAVNQAGQDMPSVVDSIVALDGRPLFMGSGGLGTGGLWIRCTDVTCTTHTDSTINSPAGMIWSGESLTLAPDGLPLIAGDALVGGDATPSVVVYKCANMHCTDYVGRR